MPALRVALCLLGVLVVPACGDAPRSTSLDLVERFPLARLGVEPAVIDLGTPAARPHLVSGWSVDERVGEGSFVWGLGERSVLEFWLAAPRELVLAARGGPFAWPGAPAQTVSFELNGVPGPTVTLEPGAADHRVVLPPQAARAGWNLLALRYGHARAPFDVMPSGDRRQLAVAWDAIGFGAAGGERPQPPAVDPTTRTLRVPAGTCVSYHLRLTPGAVLRLDSLAASGDPATTLVVRLEADGRAAETVARLRAPSARHEVRLPPEWSGIARLSLVAEGAGASGSLELARPELLVPRRPRRAPGGTTAATRRPNVVVYLVDTLRADRLGVYGHDRPTSPGLDGFARDAIRFTDAVADSPWTRPSVASLFTGLPPRAHRVNGRTDALAEEAATMAELFGAAGYETAAFVTNGNVASMYGFAQGFEVFELLPGATIPGPDGDVPNDAPPPPSSDGVTRRALEWLDARSAERPFLLYLHPADPHGPYLPPAEFRQRLGAPMGPPDLGSRAMLRRLHDPGTVVDPTMVQALQALYDAEVAQNDAEFGAVLAGLRARGLYDDALVVFLSDHGEEFHEHGGWEHGHAVYREVERVPLLLKRPGARGGGTAVDRTVQLADVLPTLLEHAGIPRPPLPAPGLFADADPAAPRVAFSHLRLDGHVGDAVVEGRWKLVATEARLALFDRAADPGEQRDVAPGHPVTVAYLGTLLGAAAAPGAHDLPARSAVAVTDDVRRNLEALGYLE